MAVAITWSGKTLNKVTGQNQQTFASKLLAVLIWNRWCEPKAVYYGVHSAYGVLTRVLLPVMGAGHPAIRYSYDKLNSAS